MEPLTTARIVLRSQRVDVDAIAQLVASFALTPPLWYNVAPPKFWGCREDWTEADALQSLKWLHARHPEPLIDTCNGWVDKSIMDNAARSGYLSVVRFLHEHRTEGFSYEAINDAAGNGHLEIVRYLFEHADAQFFTVYALEWAAAGGHLDVLKYFHEHVPRANDKWSKSVFRSAGANGHVGVVKWLLEHRTEGGPSDAAELATVNVVKYLLLNTNIEATIVMMTVVVSSGDLELVRYLHEQRGVCCIDTAVNYAVKIGRLDLVRYLHEHLAEEWSAEEELADARWIEAHGRSFWAYGGDQGELYTTEPLDIAAANNQLEIIQYLHEQGYDATTFAMDEAAAQGHLDIVQFLHEHRSEGCTTYAMGQAAKNHHMAVVKYLHSIGRKFLHENRTEGCSTQLVRNIVRSNHRPALEYVHQHKIAEIPTSALSLAAELGHRDTLAYLYEHCLSDGIVAQPQLVLDAIEKVIVGSKSEVLEYFDSKKTGPTQVYTTKAMDKAAEAGNIVAVKYLHDHDHGGCTTDAMDKAAANGNMWIVRFLHDYRSEGCTTEAIDQAAANGHADVVRFLLEHRTEGYTYKAVDMAKKNKHLEVLAVLPDYRVPWKYPGGGPGMGEKKKKKKRR
ncbi:hypothetical protein Poli38472_007363 [Pythium oligandrum]|uniref:Uncharacterized protein n=1 Tax=Pythium oligandrum TaxID=41045 RepID=A0A8K1FHY4_PYTOL|nr:hypothetical protein Poli38472_007363 [Pythium oligandrum]|eukprot:TMW59218.1 hypothetical protein Poli38472_007363 [Pythium oligandrum]